ncbi:MAG TPA: DUF167 domain-containing protein [Cytophagaceae bacterium]
MIIKPGSRKEELVEGEAGQLIIKVKALPIDGKANAAVIEFLSTIFKISKSRIIIVSGENSKYKKIVVDIEEDIGSTLLRKKMLE